MSSLGTSPNQGGDCFQHPTLKNGLGYSLSPICSVPRNLWGQEMNVIIKYLTAHGSLNYQTMEEALAYAVTKLSYESLKMEQKEAVKAFVEGNDAFVSLPTGFGKSLCFTLLL